MRPPVARIYCWMWPGYSTASYADNLHKFFDPGLFGPLMLLGEATVFVSLSGGWSVSVSYCPSGTCEVGGWTTCWPLTSCRRRCRRGASSRCVRPALRQQLTVCGSMLPHG